MNKLKYVIITLLFITTTSYAQLGGTYTIGTSSNYLTIQEAIDSLESQGIESQVVFSIKTGNYNEQIQIIGDSINYINGIVPIIFQSTSGDSSDVIISFDSDSARNYIFSFSGKNNITLQNITLQPSDTTYGRSISLRNYNGYFEFINNRILGYNTNSDDNNNACFYSDSLSQTDTLKLNIENNLIQNGSIGIDIDLNTNYAPVKLSINGNHLIEQKHSGIQLIGLKHESEIINNTIKSYNNPEIGIYFGYSIYDSTNISFNKIILSSNRNCSGIINYTNKNIISNNFISIEAIDFATIVGFYSSWHTYLYNNSFLCYGQESNESFCVILSNMSIYFKLINNNLINLNGDPLKIYYPTSVYYESDYNNIYPIDMTAWQSISNRDSHSLSINPDFVSNTDLHISAILLNGKGTPIPEITYDIDGQTRDIDFPDIGADEMDSTYFSLSNNDSIICFYNDSFNTNIFIYDIGFGYDSYSWSTGSDSSSILIDTNIANIGNNEYSVTVTLDGQTYSDNINFYYSKPETIIQTDYCINAGDTINICGITGNNNYFWFNGDTSICTNLIAENYYDSVYLIVTDNYGCQSNKNLNIESIFEPANINVKNDTIICFENSLTLIANTYNLPNIYDNYSFLWSTGDTIQTIIIDSLNFDIGTHQFSVEVKNKNSILGCISADTINVELKNCSSIDIIKHEYTFNINPNPSKNNISIELLNINKPQKNGFIYNINGELVKEFSMDNSFYKTIDVSVLQEGLYFIKIGTLTQKFVKK